MPFPSRFLNCAMRRLTFWSGDNRAAFSTEVDMESVCFASPVFGVLGVFSGFLRVDASNPRPFIASSLSVVISTILSSVPPTTKKSVVPSHRAEASVKQRVRSLSLSRL